MKAVNLEAYDNSEYRPGSRIKITLWYITSVIFFRYAFPWPNGWKIFLLRFFGARIGRGVVVKPSVIIKYPWFLKIENHVWIGEKVWIDNLTEVSIASNVCISQGAMLLTGNHDYTSPEFDLITGEILLEEGVWIGARAVVCPGVRCSSHSVLSVGSVASRNLAAYTIYSGNPAVPKRERIIE